MWHNDISMKTIQRLPLDFRVTSHYEHLGTFYQQFYCNIDLMIPINSSVETNEKLMKFKGSVFRVLNYIQYLYE